MDNFIVDTDVEAALAFGKATWEAKSILEAQSDSNAKKEKARKAREAKRAEGGVVNMAQVYWGDAMEAGGDHAGRAALHPRVHVLGPEQGQEARSAGRGGGEGGGRGRGRGHRQARPSRRARGRQGGGGRGRRGGGRGAEEVAKEAHAKGIETRVCVVVGGRAC